MLDYLLPFLVALSLLVFVHEFGHYWVARRAGIRVDVFSIGFGRELFGWTDRHGTRWRFSLIPLGGYVKMFGDMNPASVGVRGDLSDAEMQVAFHHKPLWKRAAVVFAGPAANFIFALLLLTGLFAVLGQAVTDSSVGPVQDGSPAAAAGIRSGDRIVALGGSAVDRFEQIQRYVMIRPGQTVPVTVERDGGSLTVPVTIGARDVEDRLGGTQKIGFLGIGAGGQRRITYDPLTAVSRAFEETGAMVSGTLTGLGQMLTGVRDTKEIGGVLSIAQMSGTMARDGLADFLWFLAVLSVNLGLLNLLPIPVLDGGHLMFYAGEAIYRRPLPQRLQDYGSMVGFAAIVSLMMLATWNDLVRLRVVSWFAGLIG
jgi:regulator of sigma E protease